MINVSLAIDIFFKTILVYEIPIEIFYLYQLNDPSLKKEYRRI